MNGEIDTMLLSSNVGENAMHLKVLFTDEALKADLGTAPDGTRDEVQPYAVLRNSETGQGSLSFRLGFYRSFCTNGCIFGTEEAFSFSRNHVGGKLSGGANGIEVFSDDTQRKADELIIAEVSDAFRVVSDPARVEQMASKLRALKAGEQVGDAFAAVDALAQELDIRESEKQGILGSFLRDGDMTRWGLLNAVTEQANSDDISYDRAQEIEEVGAQIINLTPASWLKIATAEKVAA